MHSLAAKVPLSTSIMAETFTTTDEVTSTIETEHTAYPPGLDEFTNKLTADDARVLVDLLKLSVAMRVGEKGRETLSDVLTCLGKAYPSVSFSSLYYLILQNCFCLEPLQVFCQIVCN